MEHSKLTVQFDSMWL